MPAMSAITTGTAAELGSSFGVRTAARSCCRAPAQSTSRNTLPTRLVVRRHLVRMGLVAHLCAGGSPHSAQKISSSCRAQSRHRPVHASLIAKIHTSVVADDQFCCRARLQVVQARARAVQNASLQRSSARATQLTACLRCTWRRIMGSCWRSTSRSSSRSAHGRAAISRSRDCLLCASHPALARV